MDAKAAKATETMTPKLQVKIVKAKSRNRQSHVSKL